MDVCPRRGEDEGGRREDGYRRRDWMMEVDDVLKKIREDFPILKRKVYDKPLVYLDNAATVQKPQAVIDAIANEYIYTNANVHRGVHYLSQKATELHEAARQHVAEFLHAKKAKEVIFTRGTTEAINLVARAWGEDALKNGDEVVVSEMEHHSNIVPWQMVCERTGARLRVIPMTQEGVLDMKAYEELLGEKTKMVAVAQVSNVLGTVNPIKKMARMAHEVGALFLVDAAQSVPHMEVDVEDLDVDFLAFSGHKVYAPTGIGVLYGKEKVLESMSPYEGGGEMIARVTWEKTTYERLPYKFEAGTPNYVGAHALSVALDYVEKVGWTLIRKQEGELTRYAMERLQEIEGMKLYGTAEEKDAVVAFNVEGIHHLDLGTLLDRLGIAIRTGHHCAQPVMQYYGVEGMCRASFAFYNTKEEVDALVEGLQRVVKMF